VTREWERSARSGDADALSAQLAAGARVDALDRHGQTALMLAAAGGHLSAVRVLVGAGADLDRTAKYRLSALMLAVVNRHEAVARELAGAGGFAGRSAADLARDAGLSSLARELSPPTRDA